MNLTRTQQIIDGIESPTKWADLLNQCVENKNATLVYLCSNNSRPVKVQVSQSNEKERLNLPTIIKISRELFTSADICNNELIKIQAFYRKASNSAHDTFLSQIFNWWQGVGFLTSKKLLERQIDIIDEFIKLRIANLQELTETPGQLASKSQKWYDDYLKKIRPDLSESEHSRKIRTALEEYQQWVDQLRHAKIDISDPSTLTLREFTERLTRTLFEPVSKIQILQEKLTLMSPLNAFPARVNAQQILKGISAEEWIDKLNTCRKLNLNNSSRKRKYYFYASPGRFEVRQHYFSNKYLNLPTIIKVSRSFFEKNHLSIDDLNILRDFYDNAHDSAHDTFLSRIFNWWHGCGFITSKRLLSQELDSINRNQRALISKRHDDVLDAYHLFNHAVKKELTDELLRLNKILKLVEKEENEKKLVEELKAYRSTLDQMLRYMTHDFLPQNMYESNQLNYLKKSKEIHKVLIDYHIQSANCPQHLIKVFYNVDKLSKTFDRLINESAKIEEDLQLRFTKIVNGNENLEINQNILSNFKRLMDHYRGTLEKVRYWKSQSLTSGTFKNLYELNDNLITLQCQLEDCLKKLTEN